MNRRRKTPGTEASLEGFNSPVELLARYFALGRKRPGRFSTVEDEERQAALFGYAYAVAKKIESLVVRPGEGPQRDFDAEFRWKEGTTIGRLPVSLKKLPPEAVNPNESLAGIIKKAAVKSTGDDLLLAIHIDRAGQLKTLEFPRKFRIKELCLWGWSKPNHGELFVSSYVMNATVCTVWTVPFPPPGFRSV